MTEESRRRVGRRLGVGEVAADGARGPDRRRGDTPHRLTEKRPAISNDARALDVGVRGHGAELQRRAILPDLGQHGHALQGDEAVGLHETESDHRDERRPARDQARLAVEPRHGIDRLAQRFGLDETERMEAHAHLGPAAAASTASTILV